MASIADLNEDYPDGATHAGTILDDDTRNTKSEILATFPNITGAVTVSHAEFNFLSSATAIQTQLATLGSIATTLEGRDYFISGRVSAEGVLYSTFPYAWTVWHPTTGYYEINHDLGIVIPHIELALPKGMVATYSANNKFTVSISYTADSSASGQSWRDLPFIFTVAVM